MKGQMTMPGQPQQFDRDALLMMYVANELPPQQRADIERQLAADPQLAAELEQLRAAQQRVDVAIGELDLRERPPVSDAVAARRAARSIQQWQLNRVVRPAIGQKKALPLPWWMYPATAAAALVIGFLVWSSRQEVPPLQADERSRTTFEFANAEADALADGLGAWFIPEPNLELADGAMAGPDDVGAFFFTPLEAQETAQ